MGGYEAIDKSSRRKFGKIGNSVTLENISAPKIRHHIEFDANGKLKRSK